MNEFPLNITSAHTRSHQSATAANNGPAAEGAEFNNLLAQQILDADIPQELPASSATGSHLASAGSAHRKAGKQAMQDQVLLADNSVPPPMLAALLGQPGIVSGQAGVPASKLAQDKSSASGMHDTAAPGLEPAAATLAGMGAVAATAVAMTGAEHTASADAGLSGSSNAATVVADSKPGMKAAGKISVPPLAGKIPGNQGKTEIPTNASTRPEWMESLPETQSGRGAAGGAKTRAAANEFTGLMDKAAGSAAKAEPNNAEHMKSGGVHETAALAAQLLHGSEQKNHPLQSPASAPPGGQPPASYTMQYPLGSSAWSGEFGQQISWMTRNKEQTAELHLNPPQLGPLDVVLKVQGDQATAVFTSQHAAVRDAVEQAIPRLREMLADSGIMLGNATVSDQAPQRNPDQPVRSNARRSDRIGEVAEGVAIHETQVPVRPRRHDGLVDTFV